MDMDQKTMETILAGIRDLQTSMLTLQHDMNDRMDALERRQGRFESQMVKRLQSYETRMAAVEEGMLVLHAGQNTIKGQLNNMQLSLDTNEDKWDVISAAYVRLNNRVKKLETTQDKFPEDQQ